MGRNADEGSNRAGRQPRLDHRRSEPATPQPQGRARLDIPPSATSASTDIGMLLGHRTHQRRLPSPSDALRPRVTLVDRDGVDIVMYICHYI